MVNQIFFSFMKCVYVRELNIVGQICTLGNRFVPQNSIHVLPARNQKAPYIFDRGKMSQKIYSFSSGYMSHVLPKKIGRSSKKKGIKSMIFFVVKWHTNCIEKVTSKLYCHNTTHLNESIKRALNLKNNINKIAKSLLLNM